LRAEPFRLKDRERLPARARWLRLMINALDEVKLPADVDALLREFFHGVSAMLINRRD